MSTVIGKDMKQHAPFDDAASRRDFLMGTTALTLNVVLPGPAYGPIEAAESFFQLS